MYHQAYYYNIQGVIKSPYDFQEQDQMLNSKISHMLEPNEVNDSIRIIKLMTKDSNYVSTKHNGCMLDLRVIM